MFTSRPPPGPPPTAAVTGTAAAAAAAARGRAPPPAHLKANPNFFSAAAATTTTTTTNDHTAAPRGRRRRPASSPSPSPDRGTPSLTTKALALALRAARSDGKLNLSNRRLSGPIPDALWTMYDAPASASASLDTSAADRWWDAVELTKLLLADNQLSHLDPRLAQVFPALQVLDLHNNLLTSPALCETDALAPLINLTALNLAGNRLTEVPSCLATLPHLITLHLNNNAIAGTLALPQGSLSKVAVLDASDNLLDTLTPSNLSHLSALTTLKLANNRLRTTPTALPETLRELDLAGNLLDHLALTSDATTVAAGGVWWLERLDVRRNRLTALHVPPVAHNLKELYLSSNRLATLHVPPGSLPALALLDVRDNQLTEVPEEVYTSGAMPNLKRLDLTNNAIAVLPPELGFLALHALNVEGNLVRGVPRSGGTVALLKWLREKLPPGYNASSPVKAQPTRKPAPPDVVPEPLVRPARRMPSSAPASRGGSTDPPPAPVEQPPPQVDEWVTLPSGRRMRRKPPCTSSPPMGVFGGSMTNHASALTHHASPASSVAPHDDSDVPVLQADMSSHANLTADVLESLALASSPDRRAPLHSLTVSRVPTVTRFPDLSPLPTLTDLVLTHCHVASVPTPLPVPTTLAMLDLSHNPLDRLPAGLSGAPALHTLTLVGCGLAGHMDLATTFAGLPMLATLILAGNQLTDVAVGEAAERALARLVCLDVSNNALARLDPRLAKCPQLHVVKVEGNCFRVPRWDVVQRGSAAVLEWCRGRLPRE